jgi:hypothetical protein
MSDSSDEQRTAVLWHIHMYCDAASLLRLARLHILRDHLVCQERLL